MFNNTKSESVEIDKLRVPFYFVHGNGEQASEVISFNDTSVNANVGGPLVDITPNVLFPAEEPTEVNIEFAPEGGQGVRTSDDFFILVVEFLDGSQNTYYVSPN